MSGRGIYGAHIAQNLHPGFDLSALEMVGDGDFVFLVLKALGLSMHSGLFAFWAYYFERLVSGCRPSACFISDLTWDA